MTMVPSGGVSRNIEHAGGSHELVKGGGARIVDGREEDVIVGAISRGVEQRQQNLRHLAQVLVAQAGEDERARLRGGKLRDGRAKRPGAGGVVGYVEQNRGACCRAEQLKTTRPLRIANALFYLVVGYFVTTNVTR